MKRSTLILLLLLALMAAAVLYYYYWWRKAVPPAPGPAPSLVSLLPADADFVFYVDAAALRASPFVQELLAALPSPKEDRDYADFVRRTGFDYTRDLDRIAAAIRPRIEGSKGRRDDSVTAIAEGRFDRQRIGAYAIETGKRTRLGGDEAYIVPAQNGGSVLLLFLAENRVLLTDSPAAFVGGVRAYGHTPVQSFESPLANRVARVAGSELFAVAYVNPEASGALTNFLPTDLVSGELKETLESIQWLTLAVRPAEAERRRLSRAEPKGPAGSSQAPVRPLLVALEAECTSPGDAKKLAWSLEGLRVLARMAMFDPKATKGMDPALAALFHTILKDGKITSADRYVRLSFSLGPDFLAALRPRPTAPNKSKRTAPPLTSPR